ncbi:hypothetical protein IAT40_006332 [Kwoniella sp. CBS 6097]
MSDYQARKARAQELQREKEEDMKRELAAKAAREKQLAKAEEERRQRQEAAAREARRQELMRANEALNKRKDDKNGNGGSKDMEYNPFAEDERRAPVIVKPAAAKSSTSKSPSATRQISSKQSHPGPSASTSKPKSSSVSGTHSSSKNKDNSPPPLGRKERAAKAFAQQAKKSAGESLFSVRALVESRDSPGPGPGSGSGAGPSRLPAHAPSRNNSRPGAGSGAGGAPTIAIHGIGMANGLKKDPRAMAMVQGKGRGSVRDQLKAQFQAEGMRKLCPDRATRDRRSIEEIQRDIKARSKKAAGVSGKVSPNPVTERDRDRDTKKWSPERGKYGQTSTNGSASTSAAKSGMKPPLKRDDRGRPIASHPSTLSGNMNASRKRRPSPSSSESGSDSDSYSSGSTSARPSKKRYDPRGRGRSPPLRLNERSSQFDVSAEIQAMFRRPGRPPLPSRRYEDDISDDGSSDMEAGLSDVEVEEKRAARIARREDEEAEREERERKLAKEKRKKEMAARRR